MTRIFWDECIPERPSDVSSRKRHWENIFSAKLCRILMLVLPDFYGPFPPSPLLPAEFPTRYRSCLYHSLQPLSSTLKYCLPLLPYPFPKQPAASIGMSFMRTTGSGPCGMDTLVFCPSSLVSIPYPPPRKKFLPSDNQLQEVCFHDLLFCFDQFLPSPWLNFSA